MAAVKSVGSDKKGKDGLEGYFRTIALKRKDLTMGMMGRLIPLEASVKHEHRNAVNAVYETVADVLEAFKARKVPVELWPPLLRAEHEKTMKLVHDVKAVSMP